jgi:hypothetical protein
VDHAHLRPRPQVAAGAGGQIGVDLEGGDAAAAPHLLRQDGGEVAGAGADMHDVLAGARGEGGHQPGVEGGLTVVEPGLGPDGDDVVRVEIERIGVRCPHIAAPPAQHPPGPGPEKVLARHGRKRPLHRRAAHPRLGHHLGRIGPANDA